MCRKLLPLLAALLVACGPGQLLGPTITPTPTPTNTPTPTPEPRVQSSVPIETELDNGWIRYDLPADGFAIALPPDWFSFVPDEALLEAALPAVGEANPDLANYLEGQLPALAAQGIRFYALQMTPDIFTQGGTTNLNVGVFPDALIMSLDRFTEFNVLALESMFQPEEPITHEAVQLPAGDARVVVFTWDLTIPNVGPSEAAVRQYIVPRGTDVYFVTFTTLSSKLAALGPVFDDIIQTFEFID
jgi:hypothetical protein